MALRGALLAAAFFFAEGFLVSRLRRSSSARSTTLLAEGTSSVSTGATCLGVAGLDPLRRQGVDRGGELVLVVLGLPGRGHVADELPGHLQLAVLQLALAGGGQAEAVARPQLVRPADGVEHQRLAVRNQGRQPLLGVHHHPGDADDAGLAHRLAQQGVDLLALADRGGEVGPLELGERDLAGLDEALDLDRLRRLRIGLLDLVLAQDHVVAVGLLDALDDVLALHLLAGALVDALVADRVVAALVEPVEVDAALLRGGIEGDRHVHQAEADGAFPDGMGHGRPCCCRVSASSSFGAGQFKPQAARGAVGIDLQRRPCRRHAGRGRTGL